MPAARADLTVQRFIGLKAALALLLGLGVGGLLLLLGSTLIFIVLLARDRLVRAGLLALARRPAAPGGDRAHAAGLPRHPRRQRARRARLPLRAAARGRGARGPGERGDADRAAPDRPRPGPPRRVPGAARAQQVRVAEVVRRRAAAGRGARRPAGRGAQRHRVRHAPAGPPERPPPRPARGPAREPDRHDPDRPGLDDPYPAVRVLRHRRGRRWQPASADKPARLDEPRRRRRRRLAGERLPPDPQRPHRHPGRDAALARPGGAPRADRGGDRRRRASRRCTPCCAGTRSARRSCATRPTWPASWCWRC